MTASISEVCLCSESCSLEGIRAEEAGRVYKFPPLGAENRRERRSDVCDASNQPGCSSSSTWFGLIAVNRRQVMVSRLRFNRSSNPFSAPFLSSLPLLSGSFHSGRNIAPLAFVRAFHGTYC